MYDCSIRGHFSSSPCGIDCLWATGCLRSNGSNDWSGQPSVGSFESLAWYGGCSRSSRQNFPLYRNTSIQHRRSGLGRVVVSMTLVVMTSVVVSAIRSTARGRGLCVTTLQSGVLMQMAMGVVR